MATRASVRTFATEELDEETVGFINELLAAANKDSGLTATFLKDGSAAFSSIKATYGLFKNVASVIVLKGQPTLEHFQEKVGYFGEKVMLELVGRGLGTCWVGGTFDRDALAVTPGESICAVLVIGIPSKAPTIIDRYMHSSHHAKRKPLPKRIDADAPLPAWIKSGMEAVVLAPSALNKQKPHFFFADGKLHASVEVSYRMDLVDLGIAKYHFELGANMGGHFEWGNGAPYVLEGNGHEQ